MFVWQKGKKILINDNNLPDTTNPITVLDLEDGKSQLFLDGKQVAERGDVPSDLGKLAFKDKITDEDIDNGAISISKIKDLNSKLDSLEDNFNNKVAAINEKIPTTATKENKLVDSDTMASAISSTTAFYCGSFDTKAALDEWQQDNPDKATNNDYAYVQSDETHNNQAWRYIFVKKEDEEAGKWEPQFKVNNSPLTSDQVKALNSGITEELVTKITTNEQNISDEIARAKAAEEINADAINALQAKDTEQDAAIEKAQSTADSKYTLPTEGIPETNLSQEVQDKLNSGGGSDTQYYDTIISSQQEFEAWYKELDASTYAGHSVLFLNGTYARSEKGLHLPETLYTIKGIGQVQINITEFEYSSSDNKAGIWYDTTPEGKEYSIGNISVNCTGTSDGHSSNYSGFSSCTNLTSCTGTGTGYGASGTGSGYGFSGCTNLTNCTGIGTGTGYGLGFSSCTNLTSCTGKGTGSIRSSEGFSGCTNLTSCTGIGTGGYSTSGCGFSGCTNLTNCTGTATADSIGKSGYAFYNCTNLTNCTGTGTVSNNGKNGYAFYDCNICSNCRQDPNKESTTGTWGGSTTANVDPDTCPEYVSDKVISHPTYYKLDGDLMQDMGGVDTDYLLAISNLTPQSPAPVVDDVVVFRTSDHVYIGKVKEAQSAGITVTAKIQIS